ncbi:hypothetical protein HN448_04425 [archaeon]|nr:hypothetical protein [archaeon]
MAKYSKSLVAWFSIAFLVIGNLLGAAFYNDNAQVEDLQSQLADAQNNSVIEIQEVEIEVDSGNLDLVLEHLYDNDGNVNYLLDDLDDDELNLIADRISFINEIKALAVNYVDAEAADELDKEVFNNSVEFDEDEIERIRVQDDADELIVSDIDFEDSDADVLVTVYFEQDDVKYEADFNVEFKDAEIDDMDLLEIRERN